MNKELIKRLAHLNAGIVQEMQKASKEVQSINNQPYEISYKMQESARIENELKDSISNMVDSHLIGLHMLNSEEIDKKTKQTLTAEKYGEINSIISIAGGRPSNILLNKLSEYNNIEVLHIFSSRFDKDSTDYEMIKGKIDDIQKAGDTLGYLIKELPAVATMGKVLAEELIQGNDSKTIDNITSYIENIVNNIKDEE